MREDIVIVAAGRTALGTFGGALAAIPASASASAIAATTTLPVQSFSAHAGCA